MARKRKARIYGYWEYETSAEEAVSRVVVVIVRIGRFPVQTPLGARPGLGTQPRYEVPGDLRVENVIRSD